MFNFSFFKSKKNRKSTKPKKQKQHSKTQQTRRIKYKYLKTKHKKPHRVQKGG